MSKGKPKPVERGSRTSELILGPGNVHRSLRRWLAELGQDAYREPVGAYAKAAQAD